MLYIIYMEAIKIYKEFFFISLIITSILSTYFIMFINSIRYSKKDLIFNLLYVLIIHNVSTLGLGFEIIQLIEVTIILVYLRKRTSAGSLFLNISIYTLLNHYLYILIISIYSTTESYFAALSCVISLICVCLHFAKGLGKVMTMEKNFKYDILIESGGNKFKFNSFLDTGNFAKEFFTNRPVVFINNKYKVVGKRKCEDYISTANGYKKIELYEVDRFAVKLNGEIKIKKVYLSYVNMKFDAIIGLDILN